MAKDKLSDRTIRTLKTDPLRSYKKSDGGGLHLLVHPNGGRYWHLKFYIHGKERLLALGTYPEISLADARGETLKAKKLIRDGIDPVAERKKSRLPKSSSNTFELIAGEWIETNRDNWSKSYLRNLKQALANILFPAIGKLPIKSIDVPKMREVLLVMQERGALALLQQVRGWATEIFRFAIATGRAESNPADTLAGTFKKHNGKNLAAIIKPEEFGELITAIHSYSGFITRHALLMTAYTFVRSSEVRGAKWEEFDLANSQWLIPAERMKGRLDHVVPLCQQTVAILEQLRPLTRKSGFVFANGKKPISENVMLSALHRLGFKGKMSVHGFRSVASTWLNEQHFNPDWIERQLAHVEKNKIRKAYNRAEYLPQRRDMMARWANHIDEISAGLR